MMSGIKKFAISSLILSFLAFAPFSTRADLYFSPVEHITLYPHFGFLINFAINWVFFTIALLLFIKPVFQATPKGKFLLAVLIITIAGFIADIVPVFLFGDSKVASYQLHFGLTFILLAIISCLVCKCYLGASWKRSVVVGVFMGVLTNPYILWLNYSYQPLYKTIVIPSNGVWYSDGRMFITLTNPAMIPINDEDIIIHQINGGDFPLGDFAIGPKESYTIEFDWGNPCQAGNPFVSVGTAGAVTQVPIKCS